MGWMMFLPTPAFFAHDSGKILVNGAAAGLTGPALAELLRRDWQFETEMSCGAQLCWP